MTARGIITAGLCCCLAVPAASACDKPAQITFAVGTSAADISGGIPRGMRDCFTFNARGGQFLAITQPGRGETNIVIQIYRPVWRVREDENGNQVTGRTLPGSGEGADATAWSGTLPVTGSYLLVVGTSWGSGEYHLRIVIH